MQLKELYFKCLFLRLELTYLLFEYFFEFSTAFEERRLMVIALLFVGQLYSELLLFCFGGL